MAKFQVHGDYEHWSMVFLYDPQTGDIVHTHQVVSTAGGAHPDRDELEAEAAEQASRARNSSVETLAFLHVDPHKIDLDAYYTVDVKSRSLVKTDPPKTAA
jgi:hypothetical protein